MEEDAVPLATAAAWSPTAAPQQRPERRLLSLDDLLTEDAPPAAEPDPEPEPPRPDRLAALRDITRRLRSAPDADETLQFVIDTASACTGSDAAMLTLQAPGPRQFVAGTALGAGPYVSVPLRAGGPSFGELVLTRLSEAAEYDPSDETFAELVAEAVARAVAAQRAGTVVSQDAQDFIDRVTEELRSPLAGAASTLAAVLAGELSGDARVHLGVAAADVRRLLGTVQALLTLAHLRPPELRHLEAVPVTSLLQAAVERHAADAEAREVALTLRRPPEAYVVQGIADQLALVVDELVANAVKFTEPGGRVDVTAGLIEGLVRISVRDTGIGFDPGEANRMTECFARSLGAEAARIPGLGIGLFLARRIAEHHGGKLVLESRRFEGTQAYVAVPPR